MLELFEHIGNGHTNEKVKCSYCNYEAADENDLKEHLTCKHEDSAIITVVGNQQLLLLEALETFKNEVISRLKNIEQSQNNIQSDLSVLKESVNNVKKSEHLRNLNKNMNESIPLEPQKKNIKDKLGLSCVMLRPAWASYKIAFV